LDDLLWIESKAMIDMAELRYYIYLIFTAKDAIGIDAIKSRLMIAWFCSSTLIALCGFLSNSLEWWAFIIIVCIYLSGGIFVRIGYIKTSICIYASMWIINIYVQNIKEYYDYTENKHNHKYDDYITNFIWIIIFSLILPLMMHLYQLIIILCLGFPAILIPFVLSKMKNKDGELENIISLIRMYVLLSISLIITSVFHIENNLEKDNDYEKIITLKNSVEMEKEQFFSNVSHEMRTPLNGILGMHEILSELLKNARVSNHDEIFESLDVINYCGVSLLELVDDLIDISKVDAGSMEVENITFNIKTLIENTAKMTRSILIHQKKSNILVVVNFNSNIPLKIKADKKKIYQILTNLISNATKFTQHGQITIDVEINNKNKLIISVTDTGIGIHEKNYKKIFNRYSQADETTTRKFGGSGIGLSLCKQLVELMNGDINIESKIGVYTKFEFYVPLISILPNESTSHNSTMINMPIFTGSTSRSHKDRCSPSSSYSDFEYKIKNEIEMDGELIGEGSFADVDELAISKYLDSTISEMFDKSIELNKKNEKIVLVVEDNKINQKVINKLLEILNVSNIEVCENGLEAVDYVKQNYQKIGLILMDIQMPVLDGIQATIQIREFESLTPHNIHKIPIYGLSAAASGSSKIECINSGMDDYLTKPIKKEELDNVLKHVKIIL
jgi:signal transduction histidine kinase/CheY-like chemotaxis protein